ncbi:hypothetical protein PVAP13_4NG265922 [Panicum virgatum]|uniref:Uncharacterized protein n=1 Tax=Panicum virgatum TaxID=38727 RepID=A0A8T0TBK8_PANVG|nr:hypothetical protein PVAP13_4NG265922 [Panicum virgatum]
MCSRCTEARAPASGCASCSASLREHHLFLCIASISSNRWRAMLGITAQCRPRVLNQAIIQSIMLRCTMDLN